MLNCVVACISCGSKYRCRSSEDTKNMSCVTTVDPETLLFRPKWGHTKKLANGYTQTGTVFWCSLLGYTAIYEAVSFHCSNHC